MDILVYLIGLGCFVMSLANTTVIRLPLETIILARINMRNFTYIASLDCGETLRHLKPIISCLVYNCIWIGVLNCIFAQRFLVQTDNISKILLLAET